MWSGLDDFVKKATDVGTKLGEQFEEGLDRLDEGMDRIEKEATEAYKGMTGEDDVEASGSAAAAGVALGASTSRGADPEEVEALRASLSQARSAIERLDADLVRAREEAEEARSDAKRFALQAARAAQSKAEGTGKAADPTPDASEEVARLESALREQTALAEANKEKFAKAVKKGKGIAAELEDTKSALRAAEMTAEEATRRAEAASNAAEETERLAGTRSRRRAPPKPGRTTNRRRRLSDASLAAQLETTAKMLAERDAELAQRDAELAQRDAKLAELADHPDEASSPTKAASPHDETSSPRRSVLPPTKRPPRRRPSRARSPTRRRARRGGGIRGVPDGGVGADPRKAGVGGGLRREASEVELLRAEVENNARPRPTPRRANDAR